MTEQQCTEIAVHVDPTLSDVKVQPTVCEPAQHLGCYFIAERLPILATATDAAADATACASACYAQIGDESTTHVGLSDGTCRCASSFDANDGQSSSVACDTASHVDVSTSIVCTTSAHSYGCTKDVNGYYYNTQADALSECTSTCLCAAIVITQSPTAAPTTAPTPAPTPECTLAVSGRCTHDWGDGADVNGGDDVWRAPLWKCFAVLQKFASLYRDTFTKIDLGNIVYEPTVDEPSGCYFEKSGDTWYANVNKVHGSMTSELTAERPGACIENCYHLPPAGTDSPTAAPTPAPTPIPTAFPTKAPTPAPPPAPPTPEPTPAPTPTPHCQLQYSTCAKLGMEDLGQAQCVALAHDYGLVCLSSLRNADAMLLPPGLHLDIGGGRFIWNHQPVTNADCSVDLKCLCVGAPASGEDLACDVPPAPPPTPAPTLDETLLGPERPDGETYAVGVLAAGGLALLALSVLVINGSSQ
jgi:hypothetical protein